MSTRIPGLFITGTDTGVGKTYVAAMIARCLAGGGLRVGVYKPAASGCQRRGAALVSDDAVALWEAAGRPADLEHVCPQRFEAPLAPHVAARVEGRTVDVERLYRGIEFWQPRSDVLLVEGVGGLMSPMADKTFVADLAKRFGFPLVVVSRNALGTINQTLQTVVAATAHFGLPIAGVVLNNPAPLPDDVSVSFNRRELTLLSPVPILAEVGWGIRDFDAEVDWLALAR